MFNRAACFFLLPYCFYILYSSVCMALDIYECSLRVETSYNCFGIIWSPLSRQIFTNWICSLEDVCEASALQIQHPFESSCYEYITKEMRKKEGKLTEIRAKCYSRWWCYVSRLMTVRTCFGLCACDCQWITNGNYVNAHYLFCRSVSFSSLLTWR